MNIFVIWLFMVIAWNYGYPQASPLEDVIVALGKVAFDNCIKLYKKKFNIKQKFIFKHGKSYLLPDGLIILSSYHPSPRNVNTKIISIKMMVNLFNKAKNLAKF